MNTPAIVADIINLEPFSEVEFAATRRQRSIQVAQDERAIMEALACHEQKRTSSVVAQRRRDAIITLIFTWFE